jgi:hypothetical protein
VGRLVVIVEKLTFRKLYLYDLAELGIAVPVLLTSGSRQTELKAKLDTGASGCIFARIYGEELGLDIEGGTPQRVSTVTGSFLTYGHPVTLSVLDIAFDTTVYFAEDAGFNRSVLGREGWLDHLRLGLVEYEGKLYLSDYNDPIEES